MAIGNTGAATLGVAIIEVAIGKGATCGTKVVPIGRPGAAAQLVIEEDGAYVVVPGVVNPIRGAGVETPGAAMYDGLKVVTDMVKRVDREKRLQPHTETLSHSGHGYFVTKFDM